MATEATWTHDFCLGCDNETYDGAYCSQACRLADMRKAGSHHHGPMPSTSNPSSPFSLPPAVDFSAYRREKGEASTTAAHPSSKRSSITSIASTSSSSTPEAAPPNLSRTSSFNSTRGSHAIYTPEISEASRQELRRYENLFDTNRHRGHRQHHF